MRLVFKFFFAIYLFAFSSECIAQKSTLILEIKNIEILQGHLFISLTQDSLMFGKYLNSNKDQIKKAKVIKNNQIIVFNNLEAGWYAISIFQDLNNNDSLDSKKFGIPSEPFGFSNNALAKFKPPLFKNACFYVDEDEQITHTINLVYRKPNKIKNDIKK